LFIYNLGLPTVPFIINIYKYKIVKKLIFRVTYFFSSFLGNSLIGAVLGLLGVDGGAVGPNAFLLGC
jgi:hypothetical protein